MSQCRLCSSNAIEVFFEQVRYPIWGGPVVPPEQAPQIKYGKLQIGICSDCGYIMLISPTPEVLRSLLYEGFYSSSNPFVEDPDTIIDARTSQLLDFIEPIFKLDMVSVLEIGAYDGQFLYQLRKRGWQVFGCEPNPIGQLAAQRYGMDIKQAYFETGLYTPSSFDLIVARFVLEHVPNPIEFLQAVWATLKPGGYVVLDMPDGESRVLNRVLGSLVTEHVSYFGAHTLKLALAQAHFIQIELLPYLGGLAVKARRGEIETTEASLTANPKILQLLASIRSYSKDMTKKLDVLQTIIERLLSEGKRIVIYGANTQTLDYLISGAIRAEQIEYIIDDDSYKQGCYLMGTNLMVYSPNKLVEKPVDVLVVSAYFSQDKIVAAFRDKLGRKRAIVKFYPTPEVVGSR
ncbi:class I SAM-dependent methyltransferase, partial [Candidatus Bathyarchaeota archaeon]|nr:class I SAM-dependent methyltransferase [Candidatus Bathyarchaeota archaeon]